MNLRCIIILRYDVFYERLIMNKISLISLALSFLFTLTSGCVHSSDSEESSSSSKKDKDGGNLVCQGKYSLTADVNFSKRRKIDSNDSDEGVTLYFGTGEKSAAEFATYTFYYKDGVLSKIHGKETFTKYFSDEVGDDELEESSTLFEKLYRDNDGRIIAEYTIDDEKNDLIIALRKVNIKDTLETNTSLTCTGNSYDYRNEVIKQDERRDYEEDRLKDREEFKKEKSLIGA